MEMKYVVPDMAQSFGTLEFAGESDLSLRGIKTTADYSKKKLQPLFRRTERRKCCGRNSRAGWRKAFQV